LSIANFTELAPMSAIWVIIIFLSDALSGRVVDLPTDGESFDLKSCGPRCPIRGSDAEIAAVGGPNISGMQTDVWPCAERLLDAGT